MLLSVSSLPFFWIRQLICYNTYLNRIALAAQAKRQKTKSVAGRSPLLARASQSGEREVQLRAAADSLATEGPCFR